ncbi:MAG: glycine betaine/L-proline ABC transporter substrate-binding protein ProX [Desulfuromonadaceae bacterium]|nr:glycine betaine/L-proline ABC transporter substrate-binding protein ProX [Desulfuromonadaceae bacterium]
MKRLFLGLIMGIMALQPAMASDKPGAGVTVQPARATWNTGYILEAIVREGMEELGYKVKSVKELTNPLFYQSVALGDIDYWANGWFPTHNNQLPRNFDKYAAKYGVIMEAGGLQGYLVSKDAVEKYNIQSLADFKRPEVRAAFDDNRDGKADLVACPPGWGCEKAIAHHLDVYDLHDHIKPIKASYSASVAEALAKHNSGKPVILYTWAPNWTLSKFKPGENVMWINVPEINPNEAQKGSEERMVVSGLKGAVSDPLKLGFIASDIQIVANKKFAEKNPAAKRFFELFTISLADVSVQNDRMNNGENSDRDIKRHAQEWIKANQTQWDAWMAAARAAAK